MRRSLAGPGTKGRPATGEPLPANEKQAGKEYINHSDRKRKGQWVLSCQTCDVVWQFVPTPNNEAETLMR